MMSIMNKLSLKLFVLIYIITSLYANAQDTLHPVQELSVQLTGGVPQIKNDADLGIGKRLPGVGAEEEKTAFQFEIDNTRPVQEAVLFIYMESASFAGPLKVDVAGDNWTTGSVKELFPVTLSGTSPSVLNGTLTCTDCGNTSLDLHEYKIDLTSLMTTANIAAGTDNRISFVLSSTQNQIIMPRAWEVLLYPEYEMFVHKLVVTYGSASSGGTSYVEDFEGATADATSFTSNGSIFNLSTDNSWMGGANFVVYHAGNGYGYDGSAGFIHAMDPVHPNSTYGQTGTIRKATGAFTVNSLWLFVTGDATQTPGATVNGQPGSVTFTGQLGGVTQYTFTKSSGFSTSFALPGNGFAMVDFSSEGSSDYTGIAIDRLEITLSGNLDYFAIDEFGWSSVDASSNTPPTASAVSISGTLQVGQELTGTYTYTDADNDPQSGSTFKWYRSDNASGLNKTAIGSANATTYKLTAADADKYISFEVTPHDGTDAGTAVESSRQGPVTGSGTCDIITPTEENSSILGTILGSSFTACDSGALSKIIVQAGYAGGPEFVDIKVYSGGSAPLTNLLGTLTNQAYVNNSINEFDFSSRNIRLDSGSVYTFVIERSSGLTSGRPHLRYINGNTYAGGELYLLNGGYDGFLPDLDLYFTLSIGPSVPNTPPVASVVTVAGPLQTGKTLTGAYTYYDAENDPEGASTYKWYRADNASGDGRAEIGGATDTVYVLTPDDEGKYIIFEVTPHDGADAGTAVESPLQGPVLPALSAKARDYTVYLGPGGTATLTPNNLDNGSMGYAGLFLDRTAFSCDDLNATGSWAALGEDDLEDWEVHDAGIAASGNGKVYMAFQDRDPASDYNLRVLEWDGAAWSQVGAAFPFNSYRRALAVGPDGNPYVAYDEPNAGDGLKVARWDGVQWILLNNHVVPSIDVWSADLKFAPDGTLYIAFDDEYDIYYRKTKTKVMRWTGTVWEPLGANGIEVLNSGHQSLAFGNGDTVYVCFNDDTFPGGKVSVYRWDGTAWAPVGAPGISQGQSMDLSMVRDSDGTPYLAYYEGVLVGPDLIYRPVVSRWNGTAWESVGNQNGVFSTQVASTSLAIGSDDALYLTYQDELQQDKTVVFKWNGANWMDLEDAGVEEAYNQKIAVADNGTVFVSQQLFGNSAPVVISRSEGIPVRLTAYNNYEDTVHAAATVRVLDTLPPVVNIQNLTVYLDTAGQAVLLPAQIDYGSSDNCGIDSVWLDATSFDCSNTGANTVTLSARDSSGNIGTGTVSVTVLDTLAPVVWTRDLVVYLDTVGNISVTVAQIDSLSSDNCGIDSLWLDVTSFACGDTGVNAVTLFVRDSSGNIGTGTASVTVLDTLAPVVWARDLVVYLDAGGTVSVSAAEADSTSFDNCGIDSLWLDATDFSCADIGVHTLTLSVRDSSGNTATGTLTVTVADTVRPVVVTQPLTVFLNGSGNAAITAGDIDNSSTDNCGIDSIWLDIADFSCNDIGTNTVTLSVRDSSGNINTGTAIVTVEDTIRPVVLTQPVTVYLDGSGNGGITISDINNGSSDNCGIDSLWLDVTDFSCNDLGVNTVTLSVRDSSGNIGTGTAAVTVTDTIRPVVVTQPVTVYLDGSGNGSITAGNINNGSTDNCGIDSLWLDITAFSCNNTGINTVTLFVRDSSGNTNTGTATVTVEDTVRPVVVTRSVSLYLDGTGTAALTAFQVNNGSNDACGIDSMWLDVTSFGCSDTGVHTVTLSVRDSSGNIRTGAATVTVRDTIRPVAIASNLTLYLDNSGEATTTAAAADNGSYDNCGVSMSLSRTTFTCVQTGLNLETLTVTDPSGNASAAQVLVTVLDTIRPQVRTRNLVLELDNQGKATLVASQLDSGSTDNCTNLLHFAADRTSFTCADTGVNTVLLTVTDNKNNSATAPATVTVRDVTPPAVHTRNITVYLDGTGRVTVAPPTVNNGSTDNCGIEALYLDRDTFTCSERGQNTVRLYARDYSGNTAWSNAVIIVIDTTRPVVQTRDTTIYLDGAGMASVTAAAVNNGSSDNCGVTSLTLDKTSFNCTNRGANTVILAATDASGNIRSGTATVTVLDTIRPVVRTKNITVVLSASGSAAITTADINDGSTDNCGIQSMTLSRTSFGCADTGNNTIRLVVTDVAGNRDSATAIVRVVDQTAPTVVTRNISVYLNAGGNATITAADVDNGSSDNCTIISRVLDKTTFNCSNAGQNTVRLTVTDRSGNSSFSQALVTVLDTVRPVVTTRNLTIYLNTSGTASITTADVDNGSSDNCGITTRNIDKSNFNCVDTGINTVTLTVTDGSGNSRSGTATITVRDTTRPVVVTRNATIYLNAGGTATLTVADVNNGSSDNCGIQTMTLSKTAFDCSNKGVNTVTLTVTDVNGNVNTVQATVTVADQTPPVVNTRNLTVYLDGNGSATITPAQVNNNSSDNCGIQTLSLDINVFDCADLGANTVMLTVTDSTGNSAQKTAIVTVHDTIRPVIDNLPVAITAYVGAGQCSVPVQWATITASDNCAGTQVQTSHLNGGIFPVGTTTVTVTARDGSNNTRTGSFTVTVADTVSPVFSNIPSMFTIVPDSQSCGAAVSWAEPFAVDNCGTAVVTKTHTSGSTFPVGSTVVSYTATDAYNNSTTIDFTVVVRDEIAPVINWRGGGRDMTVAAANGRCDAAVTFTVPVVADNCSGATLTGSHQSGDRFPVGVTTVTFTATDAAGNRTTGSFTVTVEDRQAPAVATVPADDTVGVCDAAYMYMLPTGTDNCGPVTVTRIAGLPSGNIFPAGTTVNTFELKDAAGNTTMVSFRVTVLPQGEGRLPSLTQICVYESPVDLTLGQQGIQWSGAGVTPPGTFNPAAAGTGRHVLSYTYTDGQGCSANGTIAITVLPAPVKPVVSRIGSTKLTTGNYITYQWYRDGHLIPGATTQQYTYTEGGNYQVVVANAEGCTALSDDHVIGKRGGGVGITDQTAQGDLLLYPNPSTGVVTIEVPEHWREELYIEGYGTTGQRILSRKVQHPDIERVQLDLRDLPRGMYYLHFTSGSYTTTRTVTLR